MEINDQWPGQCFALKVDEVLFHEKSKYQDVMVFQSTNYGKVLTLDGVIQCTERDEHSYQEMIAHLPLASHPCPKKVLIVGGGDGGVAREVAKHSCVEKIVMCEIDEMVVNVSKKFMPQLAKGFESPKLDLVIGDGFDYLKKHTNEFDVIITDSSDPVGPAESLFQEQYYQLMKSALRPGGIICAQGECIWLHLKLIKEMNTFAHRLFPVVAYAACTIPSYPSGQIGFCLCGLDPDTNFQTPLRCLDPEDLDLKYYRPEVHAAAFVVPHFAQKVLDSKPENGNN